MTNPENLNRLTRIQGFKLYTWMQNNVEAFAGLGYSEVADLATEELGFPITRHNIKYARNDLGLKWAFRQQNAVDGRTRSQKILEKQEDLNRRVVVIEAYLHDLKDALIANKPIPLYNQAPWEVDPREHKQ